MRARGCSCWDILLDIVAMTKAQLSRWPLSLEIPVAWGDMDSLGHVNNTVFLRWFESARVLYFERLGFAEGMEARHKGPILARQEIDYRQPLTYPDLVRAETTVERIGQTSFTMAFRISSIERGSLAAEGKGVMVMVDYRSGEKVQVDDVLKSAIYGVEAT